MPEHDQMKDDLLSPEHLLTSSEMQGAGAADRAERASQLEEAQERYAQELRERQARRG